VFVAMVTNQYKSSPVYSTWNTQ